MKRTVWFAVLLLALSASLTFAAPVDSATARKVAGNWLAHMVGAYGNWGGASDASVAGIETMTRDGKVIGYNFLVTPRGHIVVGARDDIPPVRIYSDTMTLHVDEANDVYRWMVKDLAGLGEAVDAGFVGESASDNGMTVNGRLWAFFRGDREQASGTLKHDGVGEALSYGPLLSTTWDQESPYNQNCPLWYDGVRTITGCVATAAAQIMNYWEWPATGQGSTSYSWNNGSSTVTLSADFSTSTYDWANMLNSYSGGVGTTAQKAAVAKLMQDAGYAWQMTYGKSSAGGSAASTLYGATTYPAYFKYRSSIQTVYRTSYATSSAWYQVFRGETAAGRPSHLRIQDPSAGGHSVVVDGYRDSPSETIHINLGWSGSYDGWYTSDNFTTGGYNWSNTTYQAALIGIEPDNNPLANDECSAARLYASSSYTDSMDTSSTTQGVGDPSMCSGGSYNTVWYRFTAPSSGTLTLDTIGSGYDTVLAAYTGSCGSLTQVGCDGDSGGAGNTSWLQVATTSGTTYYILVASYSNGGGSLVFNSSFAPAAVANDECSAASSYASSSYTDSMDTSSATQGVGDPSMCSGGSYNTVWYRFTAPSSGTLTVDTIGSGYDTVLAAYTGSCGSLTQVGCNDDGGGSLTSRLLVAATSGTTYYILVASYSNGGGSLVFNSSLAPATLANDECSAAKLYTSSSYTDSMDTSSATQGVGDPSMCSGESYNTVWYRFTAPSAGTLTVDTIGSGYDTVLAAYTGSCGSLTQVGCNDDGGGSLTSRLQVAATSGTTYYMLVASYSNGGGSLTFNSSLGESLPTVTVAANDGTATETGTTTGQYTFTRTGGTTSALTVNYVVGGSATSGSDYTSIGTSVTIEAGSTTATKTVTPIDDTAVESDETVVVTLNASAAYTVGSPSSATVTIADNDGPTLPVSLDQTSWTFTTGGSANWFGQTGTTHDGVDAAQSGAIGDGQSTYVQVSRTFSECMVSFWYKVSSEAGWDYLRFYVDGVEKLTQSGEVAWALHTETLTAGSHVLKWEYSKDAECCTSGSDATWIDQVTESAVTPPTVTVEANDGTATEAGTTTGQYTFTRTGGTTSALTVNYVVGGSATSGSDYTSIGTSVTIEAGSTTATKTVTPIDDMAVEDDETVVVTLSASAAYTVGSPSSATVTITDNDVALPTVTVSASDATATEAGATTGQFTVTRTGPTTSSLTVSFVTTGSTATSGADYGSIGTGVTIGAGSSSATITVTPIDDTAIEGDETVILTLGANATYTVGSPSSATVTIQDRTALPRLMANDFGGDGKADILWRHTEGAFFLWQMDGTTAHTIGYIPPIDTSWQVTGLGDLNGDRTTDILWRHSSGMLYAWLMDGAVITLAGSPATEDMSWTALEAADLGGDGKADIFWRHTSGALFLWQMNGLTVEVVGYVPPIDLSWSPEALGDFNGDGKNDILWRYANGMLYLWLMDGQSAASVGSPGTVDSSWTVADAADFTGDGKADILWRHSSGATAIWQMEGLAQVNGGAAGTIDAAWTIADASDFNGDGKADILWRHTSGLAYVWLMDGWTKTGEGSLGLIDPSWVIQNR